MTHLLDFSHRVFVLPSGRKALCLKCAGVYEIGAAGHAQADQIQEAAKSFLEATRADCLLLDYTDLDYQWGDDLWLTFQIEHPSDVQNTVPYAVVVGPKCSAAIKSLLEDDGGYDTWLDAVFIFFDETSALAYLNQIRQLETDTDRTT